ncbi:hypothetical protein K435DRAFT_221987 [Dendrothele bispora CBS 962.96]|uniref:Uncharacterized protein n=1 Tax=Dendrothele bispora (strain CBS 962.96) TaxID=1314807 RepID=A0A4S8LSK6_DENBC|nr:hypothetical protein K435DRAFT_221987 [Dendrothele bispora CBS 962.96]
MTTSTSSRIPHTHAFSLCIQPGCLKHLDGSLYVICHRSPIPIPLSSPIFPSISCPTTPSDFFDWWYVPTQVETFPYLLPSFLKYKRQPTSSPTRQLTFDNPKRNKQQNLVRRTAISSNRPTNALYSILLYRLWVPSLFLFRPIALASAVSTILFRTATVPCIRHIFCTHIPHLLHSAFAFLYHIRHSES